MEFTLDTIKTKEPEEICKTIFQNLKDPEKMKKFMYKPDHGFMDESTGI